MTKTNKVGRPTKYKPEYCQMLIEFFDVEPFYEKEMPHYKDGEISWVDYKLKANPLPTIRKFAKKIGVHVSNVYRWINEHVEFCDSFTQAKELRKWMLIENGLNGCYNPAFAIFVAKNITDMKDTSTHEGEFNVNVNITLDQAQRIKDGAQ